MMQASRAKQILFLFLILLFPTVIFYVADSYMEKYRPLPYFGRKEVDVKVVDGEKVIDTVYQTIRKFSFVNQYGETITEKNFAGKIYIADFFFTRCAGACPIMSNELGRVQEAYKDEENVMFLSHTVDPGHDTLEVLQDYASKIGAKEGKWHLVTGDKEQIYEIAKEDYMIMAGEGDPIPRHGSEFALIDKERRIRGIYDGLDSLDVNRLIVDIDKLLYEYELKEQPDEKIEKR